MPRNRSSRLGYEAEHAIETFLTEHGFTVYRPRAGSPMDKGDVLGTPVVISVKNWKRLALAEWVDALPRMKDAAGREVGVVWHKKRGKGSPGDWYVTLTGEDFLALLAAYREAG